MRGDRVELGDRQRGVLRHERGAAGVDVKSAVAADEQLPVALNVSTMLSEWNGPRLTQLWPPFVVR